MAHEEELANVLGREKVLLFSSYLSFNRKIKFIKINRLRMFVLLQNVYFFNEENCLDFGLPKTVFLNLCAARDCQMCHWRF